VHAAIAALTAAQILIHAPQQELGATRASVEKKLGPSGSVGTDFPASPFVEGGRDQVLTLGYPGAQIRVYAVPGRNTSALLAVVSGTDLIPTRTGVKIGADRGALLRELGGPDYEDEDQLVYSDPHPDDPRVSDQVRLLLKDDRLIGIEWRYAVGGAAR
jgi:hypothetical protein